MKFNLNKTIVLIAAIAMVLPFIIIVLAASFEYEDSVLEFLLKSDG